jgi:hypothetical protein
MDRLRYFADVSIRRACGFGLIAIATAMTGMSHDVVLAMRGGAVMFMIMGAILLWKALRAGAKHYRRTEVWILLDGQLDWPEHRRQELIGGILRERYMWHAEVTAIAAAALWVLAFFLSVLRAW